MIDVLGLAFEPTHLACVDRASWNALINVCVPERRDVA